MKSSQANRINKAKCNTDGLKTKQLQKTFKTKQHTGETNTKNVYLKHNKKLVKTVRQGAREPREPESERKKLTATREERSRRGGAKPNNDSWETWRRLRRQEAFGG